MVFDARLPKNASEDVIEAIETLPGVRRIRLDLVESCCASDNLTVSIASVAHRIDTEVDNFAQFGEMPSQRIRVPAVATLDHHSILE
jgi:hypothetical protein